MEEGCCEHGDEPSGSIKCLGNSGVAAQLVVSEEGFRSMESVKLALLRVQTFVRRQCGARQAWAFFFCRPDDAFSKQRVF
jgi:hypothetical protein